MTTNALSRAISLEELEPGDVLLSRGVGSLSDLICSVDGGSYSHAGVWDGQCVVEATLGGIAANPIGHALESQQYVDVYRFCRDGSRLGAHEWPAAPVIGQARSFVGMKYAYADLLLAAVVVALGRRTSLPVMKRALRQLGALAGQQMARKIFCAEGRGDAKICTQVVVSAFYDAAAEPRHRYGLDVRVKGGRESEAGRELVADAEEARIEVEYAELSRQWRGMLCSERPSIRCGLEMLESSAQEGLGLSEDQVVRAGGRRLPASCVTPRDLETSPSLELLGRIAEGDALSARARTAPDPCGTTRGSAARRRRATG